MRTLSILIVDDEPLAIRRLELLLDRIDDVSIVGRAQSGEDALQIIKSHRPDVVLLDIRMGGLDGLGVVEALAGSYMPQIIFVTAFDHFAARAFDIRAADYVVKPVAFSRLSQALDRAREALRAADSAERARDLQKLLAALRHEGGAPDTPRFETQLWGERRGAFEPVHVVDIEWIEAERDYVRLHTKKSTFLLRETLSGIETRLDPAEFMRVRRSALVRRSSIAAIRKVGYGDVRIELRSGNEVRVGRTYVSRIQAMLRSSGRHARASA
jgi:DNA-binding LytR/AlgR family response regulator